ncbi:MAG: ABC transporter permease [Candidatus Hermodarchaeota archaeon]
MILASAFKNLRRNRERSIIIIIVLVSGMSITILFNGLVDGAENLMINSALDTYIGHVQIVPANSSEGLLKTQYMKNETAFDLIQELEAVDLNIRGLSPRLRVPGIVNSSKYEKTIILVGILNRERVVSTIEEYILKGTFEFSSPNTVILGNNSAAGLGSNLGDNLTVFIYGQPYSFTVGGIFQTGQNAIDNNFVYLPLFTLQNCSKIIGVSEIVLRLDNYRQAEEFVSVLSEEITLPSDVEVKEWSRVAGDLLGVIELNRNFMTIFYVLTLVVIAGSIANVVFMAVSERKREIGVLMALGLKNQELLALFVVEASLIGFLGASLGTLIGVITILVLSITGIPIPTGTEELIPLSGTVYPVLSVLNIMVVFCLCICITVFAALYPAWKASRQDPVEVLRYE